MTSDRTNIYQLYTESAAEQEIVAKYAPLIKNGVLEGDVNILGSGLTKIPSIFRGIKVTGGFYCHSNQLTSLEGAPQSVGGVFYCNNNQLTSLEGAPQSVGGNFLCNDNQLTSLEGAPQSVGGSFHCYNNRLASLEGAPQSVGDNFGCSNNQLTSLEGAPQHVGGGMYFLPNPRLNILASIKYIPKESRPGILSLL